MEGVSDIARSHFASCALVLTRLGATAAVGSSVSETMHERPALFTPVTIRRTFPGMSFSYVVEPATASGRHMPTVPLGSVAARGCKTSIA